MANQEHVERLKRSIDEWNQWRQQQPALRPDLSFTDLKAANLMGADLSFANLRETDLSFADLKAANLMEADLGEANLSNADLSRADLRVASLSFANLKAARLMGTDLRSTQLNATDLSKADLSRSDLSYTDFYRTHLYGTKFTEVHFRDTTFVQVDLNNTKELETAVHGGPSTININSVILPTEEHIRKHFLRGVGFTETQIEYLPSLLTPQPIQYHSLFISYASQDGTVARRLHADLRKHDVPCWFAPHDLRPGTPILRGLEEAIHLQDKFLLILSKQAVNSRWIEREVDAALHQEIKRDQDILFPIRLDNAILESNAGWAVRLQHRHIGDFTGWQDNAAYQQAFTTLLRHLKVSKSPTL